MREPAAAADHASPVLDSHREEQNRRHTHARRKQSSSGDLKVQDTPFNLGAEDLKAVIAGVLWSGSRSERAGPPLEEQLLLEKRFLLL